MRRVMAISRYIDIGANLTDEMYQGIYHGSKKHTPDLEKVLSRSWQNGMDKMIITGGSLSDSKKALDLANTDERLFCTVGCHPTRCNEFTEDPEKYLFGLRELIQQNKEKVVAIGECGLDYERLHFCEKDVQLNCCDNFKFLTIILAQQIDVLLDFLEQHPELALGHVNRSAEARSLSTRLWQQCANLLNSVSSDGAQKSWSMWRTLSKEFGLPLFLHCRAASDDLVDILQRNQEHIFGGVVHSFDGNQEALDNILSLGLSIGINGCSLRTNENLEVAAKIPQDKLLIETDSPWCEVKPTHPGYCHVKTKFPSVKKEKYSPESNNQVKGRNEPVNIVHVLEILSAIRKEKYEELAQAIYENTIKLFFSNK